MAIVFCRKVLGLSGDQCQPMTKRLGKVGGRGCFQPDGFRMRALDRRKDAEDINFQERKSTDCMSATVHRSGRDGGHAPVQPRSPCPLHETSKSLPIVSTARDHYRRPCEVAAATT